VDPDLLSREAIRRALRTWHSVKTIGEYPLADLEFVEARRKAAGYGDTPSGRGLALREILNAAIDTLRPDDGEPNLQQKCWRPYIILKEQYVHGHKPEWVAAQLYVSRRTYYDEQRRALERVADVLLQWDEQHRDQDAAIASRPAPYRGLFAFRQEDAPFFFGRDVFTTRLLETVRKNALVVVIGPSGSGKSSVVFAGLIPHLHESGHWAVVDFRPGSQPFHALASALVPLVEPGISAVDHMVETRKMAAALDEGVLPLSDVVDSVLQKNDGTRHLILVADQFEELYALCTDLDVRRRFPTALFGAVNPALPSLHRETSDGETPPFVLVLTLRADFVGQALAQRPFADVLQKADVKLGPMTRDELMQAIERPAARLGVTLEPGLVERILDDVGDEPGNLPLLEFALTLLWERRTGRCLTHAAYKAIGRVQGALARYAREVYGRLSEGEKLRAQRVFTQLVRPGEGTGDTRRLTTRTNLSAEDWSLVQRLADRRLVVTGQDLDGQETVEVVHEALIHNWRRLREWMDADRDFRSWQERLRTALQQWDISGRDEAALLQGTLLVEAENWLAARRADLTESEREFIQASGALRERRVAEREARRQRELEAAQQLARTQRRRAEDQAQAARKLSARARLLTGALVVAAVLALLAAGLGRQARQNANWAERQREIAVARQLMAQSYVLLGDQLDLALLLSLEANEIFDAPETRGSLLTSLQVSPRLVTFLRGHFGIVQWVAFSPDGKLLASAGANGAVRLWRIDYLDGLPSVKPLGEPLRGHDESSLVNCVTFSPDGALLATASDDGTVRLWDVGSGEHLATLEHPAFVQSVAFSPDGHILASSGGNGTVQLWDVETGQLIATLRQHSDTVWKVVFSPDGQTLATGSSDRTIVLWDLNTHRPRGEPLVGHLGWVTGIDFSPDGRTLASTSNTESTIRLWDVATGDLVDEFVTRRPLGFPAVVFSPDGGSLVTSGLDGRPGCWNAATGDHVGPSLVGHVGSAVNVAVSPDGRLLASGDTNGNVILWDASGELGLGKRLFAGQTGDTKGIVLSSDGRIVALSKDDGGTTLHQVEDDDALNAPSIRVRKSVAGVAFDSGDQVLATTTDDGIVELWDLRTGQVRGPQLAGHSAMVRGGAFDPDGKMLATGACNHVSEELGCERGEIILWDVDSGQLVKKLVAHTSWVRGLAFSPDGGTLASGSCANIEVSGECVQGEVLFWDVSTGEPVGAPLMAHTSQVNSVAFSPDGRILASGSEDMSVLLWDVATGQPIGQRLLGHAAGIVSLAFSPDGRMLASGGNEAAIFLWDVATGQRLGFFTEHLDSVTQLAFRPDGQALVSGSDDGTVIVWDLDLDVWRARACHKARRNMTLEEWTQFLGDEPYRETCADFK
jgi:WD40 repeat protein